MAVTHSPAGFTGTVDQIDEARRFAVGGGGRFRVNSSSDWTPTASGSVNRTVSIAAGMAAACGVLDVTTAADTVAFAANAGGSDRFDAVVASFDWSTGVVSFRVVQGTTVPPVVVRTGTTVDLAKINWLPGFRYDAVLAIVRARPGVTLLAPSDLFDCRLWGDWGLLNVASAAFPGQLDLDAGAQVRDSTSALIRKRTDGNWESVANRIISGSASPTMSAGVASNTYAVPFGTTFTTPPRVFLNGADSANDYGWLFWANSVTTTGFTLRVHSSSGAGAAVTGVIAVAWMAVGN